MKPEVRGHMCKNNWLRNKTDMMRKSQNTIDMYDDLNLQVTKTEFNYEYKKNYICNT